ncbi:MAG TPA: TspO/MBR family protein [Clostridia bacterium]|nr:TspO/MBR family protein [Clostridia bacterium]
MRFCKTFNLKKQIIPFTLCLAIPLLTGFIAGSATANSAELYQTLILPPLSPPSFVFPLVWTILYALMGVSSYIILKSNSWLKMRALSLYFLQLIFNFLWTFFFFTKQMYLFSFIWLMVLWIMVIVMIRFFWQIDKKAAILQVPYFLWLTFAAYLNFSIFLLNK